MAISRRRVLSGVGILVARSPVTVPLAGDDGRRAGRLARRIVQAFNHCRVPVPETPVLRYGPDSGLGLPCEAVSVLREGGGRVGEIRCREAPLQLVPQVDLVLIFGGHPVEARHPVGPHPLHDLGRLWAGGSRRYMLSARLWKACVAGSVYAARLCRCRVTPLWAVSVIAGRRGFFLSCVLWAPALAAVLYRPLIVASVHGLSLV